MKIPSHRIVAGALVFTAAIAWAGLFWPVAAAGEANPAKRTVRNRPLPLAGKLLVTGTATINGKKALSGSTIFSENRITVAKTTGNVATITLGGLGRLDLQPGTELVLRFADGIIGGELLSGEAVIRNNAGVKVALQTPLGLVAADGQDPAATVASTQLEQVLTPQQMAEKAVVILNEGQNALKQVDNQLTENRQKKDMMKLKCVNDKLMQIRPLLNIIEQSQLNLADAVKAEKVDVNLATQEYTKLTRAKQRIDELQAEANQCGGEDKSHHNSDDGFSVSEIVFDTVVLPVSVIVPIAISTATDEPPNQSGCFR